jgi:hypothetical protein
MMKKVLLVSAFACVAFQANAADCNSVLDAFNRNISEVNATVESYPLDNVAYKAMVDLQVNGEWLVQHNCSVDRKSLNTNLTFAQKMNAIGSMYRANDRLLHNH